MPKNETTWPAWQTILDDLQIQMDSLTFDQLLRGSSAVLEGQALTVSVSGSYAAEWLENRLRGQVERTVARIAGESLEILFIAGENGTSAVEAADDTTDSITCRPERSDGSRFALPDYDLHDAGWYPVSEYECRFWAPLLGRVAWRVWEIVRRADKRKRKTDWTPSRRWTAPELAEMVPCGRQAVLGVARACEPGDPGVFEIDPGVYRVHQPGAFDRLQDLGVAIVERQGQQRHTVYWIKVRVKLGLLLPGLVGQLPARLQVAHDRWLERHGFEPEAWR